MITASNNLKFNNDSTTDYNKITFKDKIYFGSGDNQKQLEFKKDGRVFYNGIQIYYTCKENCVDCNNCNDSTCYNCAGKCNNCDACNRQCNSCTACNTCWNCVKCNERCNACTVCNSCNENICTHPCQSCIGSGCNGCNSNCHSGFSCDNNTASGPTECDYIPACYSCRTCNNCQGCNTYCYFFDGAPGDCDNRYIYYYVKCIKTIYKR